MKIKKNRMIVCDTMDKLIETKYGITCGCGNPSLKMVLHMDRRDSYMYQYSCCCGNSISIERKRSKKDAMYWD